MSVSFLYRFATESVAFPARNAPSAHILRLWAGLGKHHLQFVSCVSPDGKRTERYITNVATVSTSTVKKIGSGEDVHMPADELLPGRRLTSSGASAML